MNQKNQACRDTTRRALRNGVLFVGAATGAVATVNALIAWNTPPLGGRLSGGFNRYPARHGDMAYFVSGAGAPLLLLHAPRPGNSCAEWEHNFRALTERFTVYAPDFLGWGLSDKPHHLLRPADHAEQIRHFSEDVIGAGQSNPCVCVASGEACTFALMAAQQSPHLFSRLVLVCPATGEEYSSDEGSKDALRNPIHQLLTLPVVGEALINSLISRGRLENDAKRKWFFDKTRANAGFIARTHVAAHQPGASHALAAHFAGEWRGEWREAWSTLRAPALLVWGRNAMVDGFDTAPEWLALKPDADLEVFDEALLLPHVEHAADFNARVLKWLQA